MPVCLIGLGSNQGDRRAILDRATTLLAEQSEVSVLARSAWHETSPIGGPARQSDYLNGAIRLSTSLGPHELLAVLQQIENHLGRRRTERWAARTIDLDLLLYDRLTLDSPTLVVPHPRMAFRRFVLEPAAEVAAEMIHPRIGWSIAQLLEHINTTPPYLAVTGAIAAGKTKLAQWLAGKASAKLILERPNWRQLKGFYENPGDNALQTEMAILSARAELLGGELEWASCRCLLWTCSDFWFDQSAAFARAWLPSDQFPTYVERFEQLRSTVVRPRLIVLLDAPAEELLRRVRRRGRQCEQRLTIEQLDRLRRELRQQVLRPDTGPVLDLGPARPAEVRCQVLAAMQGMQ